MVLRLRNGCHRITRFDEHHGINPNGVCSPGSVNINYTERVKDVDSSIHTTHSSTRHSMECSVCEASLRIINKEMENVGGCSVPESVWITNRNGKSDVCSVSYPLCLNRITVHEC